MKDISADNLFKQSSSQINYLISKKINVDTTDRARFKGKKLSLTSYVGRLNTSKIAVNFIIDQLQVTNRFVKIIETVTLTDNITDFQNSIIKLALYKSLLKYSYPTQINISAFLKVNEDIYRVNCDEKYLLRFFLTKARAGLNPETCKKFDKTYPKKSYWNVLSNTYINYRKVRRM